MRSLRLVSVLAIVLGFAIYQAAAEELKQSPHWSFQPVVRPVAPAVKSAGWPRNAIDDFILARLESSGLTPSPQADRHTLIRRLKFDLLGLPPTPEEVAAFVRDPDPLAYEKLIDRYLASPHYGERWARHWLDVVRFAESDGFETNQPRANAWPYRDYVIRSLNEDKPYDRFILEQFAGDQLGANEATGFLVGGAVDKVKSPDPVLTLQQRADELHDMVSTTGSTFLGLTVGCARCHDHKFDPVSQVDYYAMKAVFAGVQHGDRPLASRDSEQRKKQAAVLRRELAEVTARLEAMEPLAKPGGPEGLRNAVNPVRNLERFAPVRAKLIRFTVLATNNIEPCIDEIEILAAGPSPRNVALASLGTLTTSGGNYSAAPSIHRLEFINDGKYGNSHSWISNQSGAGWVQLELKEPAEIDRIIWARDREGKFQDRLAVKYRIEVALRPGEWKTVASSDDRVPHGSKSPPKFSAEYQRLTEQRTSLEARATALERSPMAYAGQFTTPEPVHLLNRGDPMQKREPVAPASLVRFGSKMQLSGDAKEAQRRRALAKWIADPNNPLTARVLVNRLWHYHFGQGIVATPSDFGRNGAKPSHVELLDWLADEFVQRGWSVKHTHRLIVLSATYRQSSWGNPAGFTADAGVRLLWRFPPRRLEAEPLRDAILSVSGNLDLRMGGPGFDLFEPNTNYVKVYNSKQSFGPAEWRRMIYQNKPRMQLDDTFGQFDCPDAGQITPKRTSSTTALQALNLLNGRFIIQQAGIFAERIRHDVGNDGTIQVRYAFQLAFQREASAEELAGATKLLQDHGLESLCRALLNANEFVTVR
jgi:Protein of unknown function (DUF1553)/Protein of unknown function (DUF1549)